MDSTTKMFISQEILYLELHKTGSSYVRDNLCRLVGGELQGKHNQTSKQLLENRFVLGSVRNPWEWYLSLWSYGCDRKGGLFNHLVAKKSLSSVRNFGWKRRPDIALRRTLNFRSHKKWRELYREDRDVHAFREWIKRINDPKYRQEIGEHYGHHPISSYFGIMTFRYLRLFCETSESAKYRFGAITNYSDLLRYDEENCFADFFIKTDNLETDLSEALIQAGQSISNTQRLSAQLSGEKNSSSTALVAKDYYDSETAELINDREKLIIEKFGFSASPRI